ncbi:hypothetical protein M0802_006547 [Mischocyttarus mexicanus]|nr:hypothetical protein M0802_006547 [Mischocyttarus mexicanus]
MLKALSKFERSKGFSRAREKVRVTSSGAGAGGVHAGGGSGGGGSGGGLSYACNRTWHFNVHVALLSSPLPCSALLCYTLLCDGLSFALLCLGDTTKHARYSFEPARVKRCERGSDVHWPVKMWGSTAANLGFVQFITTLVEEGKPTKTNKTRTDISNSRGNWNFKIRFYPWQQQQQQQPTEASQSASQPASQPDQPASQPDQPASNGPN